jgi:hypothetical protein
MNNSEILFPSIFNFNFGKSFISYPSFLIRGIRVLNIDFLSNQVRKKPEGRFNQKYE